MITVHGEPHNVDDLLRIVPSIEELSAIRAILARFEKNGALEQAHHCAAARAPLAAAA